MVQGVESLNGWAGLEVFLPNGRKLGVVHDAVIDIQSLKCTHLFVKDTPDDLVEEVFTLQSLGAGFVLSTILWFFVGFLQHEFLGIREEVL